MGGEEVVEVGGCRSVRGRSVYIGGIGSGHIGICSMYSVIYICGFYSIYIVYGIYNMFSIYIVYTVCRLYGISCDSMYRWVPCGTIYNWVVNMIGLVGVCQLGRGVGFRCPMGRLWRVGDMRHSSS